MNKKGTTKFFVILLGMLLIAPTSVYGDIWMLRHDITEKEGSVNSDTFFYIHRVGWDENRDPEDNHLAYSFYFFGDHHIGGLLQPYRDYNLNSYWPDLDLSEPLQGLPDKDGGPPGWHLNKQIHLVNNHFDNNYWQGVENGEVIFLLEVGDIASEAERAELQHAKIKLDSLKMPWITIIGNHDGWSHAGAPGSGKNWRSDWYYEQVFGPQFDLMAPILPNFHKKPTLPLSDSSKAYKTRVDNWKFNMGPNGHVGLDFVPRSIGGWEPWATMSHDSWDWWKTHRQNHVERTIFASHIPLTAPQIPDERPFTAEAADDILHDLWNLDLNKAYWFAGHTHPDPHEYWVEGVVEDWDDTLLEVHISSASDKSYPVYVGLVKVYSDFVCDYTIFDGTDHDDTVYSGEPVTFTSISNYYVDGESITEYGWNFGDNPSDMQGFTISGSSTTHTYSMPGVYWTKHLVKNSDNKNAYMIRRVLVEVDPLWLEVKWVLYGTGTPGGPVETEDCKQWASLKWSENYYPGWIIDHYTAHRYGPYKKHVWVSNPPGGYWIWVDCGPELYPFKTLPWYKPHCIDNHFTTDNGLWAQTPPFYLPGDFGQWRVDVTYSGRGTYQSNVVEKIAPECPPPGGCPEVYTYYSSFYDSLTQTTSYGHIQNNTILPHSETPQYAGQVRTDLLKLEGFNPESEYYYLNIIENDDETSYIDEAKLWVVDHPESTKVATSSDGEIYVYSDVAKPLSCQDQGGADRYDKVEYQDDQAFLGDSSSYLTVSFPNNDWANQGLLLGTGIPSGGSEVAPMPKDYLGIPKKPDGGGGWIPMGEAFARKEPSLWMFDVSDVQDNTFRIDCSGDSCYINYVGLVRLEESGWTKTAMFLDSAVHWYPYGAGMEGSNVSTQVYLIDSVYVILYPDNQLALRFDTLQSSTLMRDFVLQTSGFYIPGEVQGGGQSTGTSDLAFSLTIPQIITLTKMVSICYTLPYSTSVKIAVYDVQGRLVNKLVDGEASQGVHELMWNGKDGQNRSVSAGVYFIRMNADDFEQNRKIVLLK